MLLAGSAKRCELIFCNVLPLLQHAVQAVHAVLRRALLHCAALRSSVLFHPVMAVLS